MGLGGGREPDGLGRRRPIIVQVRSREGGRRGDAREAVLDWRVGSEEGEVHWVARPTGPASMASGAPAEDVQDAFREDSSEEDWRCASTAQQGALRACRRRWPGVRGP